MFPTSGHEKKNELALTRIANSVVGKTENLFGGPHVESGMLSHGNLDAFIARPTPHPPDREYARDEQRHESDSSSPRFEMTAHD